MSALDALRDSPFAYHLGWTLLHFLWQGLLVGGVYACLRYVMAEASPQARYVLSLAMLAVLAVLPVITFLYLLGTPVSVQPIIGIAAGNHVLDLPQAPTLFDSLRTLLHPLVPWTVPVWSIGVLLLGFKAFAGWRRARTLTRQASHAAPETWQDTLVRLAAQVGVRMQVRLMVTARVAVPCVVGWLRPVILLPPAALTGLSVLQLEMVLAHELSHIRRHDYLVNLLQVVVETLLFYHPVVRWVSRDARRERELCCDDSAVHACGDALHYAHALTDLAALRRGDVNPAMGVTGGDLAMRVERLITPHHVATPRVTSVILASALCLSGMLAMVSARHLSFPMPWTPNLSLPHTAGLPSTAPATGRQLDPTQVRAIEPARLQPRQLEPEPQLSAPITAPVMLPTASMLMPVTTEATVVEHPGPVQIGGKPLSSLLAADDKNTALDANKRATAPMKFISMNQSGNEPRPPSHEYCEPITGSRVCN